MRKDITVAAEPREARGKNEARRLRARGLSPAIVYGPGKDPVAIAVDPKEVNTILKSTSGHNTIFNLDLDGQPTPVMIVDWQHDPVKRRLLHLDMKRIDLEKRIVVKVPVHTHGDPVGVKLQGGQYEIVSREIEIECLPEDIPEGFNISVAELGVGKSVRASDVPLSGSMKLVSAPEAVISHVVPPKGAEPTAEAEAVAEPEVIKKGKKEDEEKKDDKKKK